MKQYKVIGITNLWSAKRLAKKSENAINTYSQEGWKFVNLQYSGFGMSTVITFIKEN